MNTGDGPRDPSINAGDGRDPVIADGGAESGVNTLTDGKNSPEVVKKRPKRAQTKSDKSPKRCKGAPKSGIDGAVEATSDNNSMTDRDSNSENITAGRDDDINDAIKDCGDHGRGRFRLPPPPQAA